MRITASDILKLIRIRLSCAIAFSATVGFIFYSHKILPGSLLVFTGVFLLSSTASALNQFQEKDLDLLMQRTKNRPLPSGRISSYSAITLSVILGLTGLSLLFAETTTLAAFLGAFNLLWYNGVYTPLKRKTCYSLLAGAVTGAVPPVIGWTAAGGSIFDPGILFLACIMFLWQVPHFLLLTLKYGKEYEDAGIPVLLTSASESGIKFLTFIWLLGTAAGTLLFPAFGIISGMVPSVLLLILNCLFIIYFHRMLFNNSSVGTPIMFRAIHFYCACILFIIAVDVLGAS